MPASRVPLIAAFSSLAAKTPVNAAWATKQLKIVASTSPDNLTGAIESKLQNDAGSLSTRVLIPAKAEPSPISASEKKSPSNIPTYITTH